MKTLIKGLTVFLLALFLNAGLASSLALADSAAFGGGATNIPAYITNSGTAYTLVETEHRFGNYTDLLATTLTKSTDNNTDIKDTPATFTFTLTVEEGSSLIGQKPKDVLWLGGVVADANFDLSAPEAFTFASALALNKYTVEPESGTPFLDTDTFKTAGTYTVKVQVPNNPNQNPQEVTTGIIDSNSEANKVRINFVFVSWYRASYLSWAQDSSIALYSIKGQANLLNEAELTNPAFVPKDSLVSTQKNLVPLAGQTVEVLDMRKSGDTESNIDTQKVLNFELEYTFKDLAENTYTFGADNHFVPQFKEGDNFVSLLATNQQNIKSNVLLSQAGQFVIYEGSTDQANSATSPLSAVEVGSFIKPNITYTIRYAVLSDEAKPYILENTMRLVGPKNPLTYNASDYLNYPQLDPKADYKALAENTTQSISSERLSGIGYGFLKIQKPVSLGGENHYYGDLSYPLVHLKTDIVGQEGLKFVTYAVEFSVPDYTGSSDNVPEVAAVKNLGGMIVKKTYIDLKPTINDIKVKDYSSGEEFTRVSDITKLTKGGLFLVTDGDSNIVQDLDNEGNPTALTATNSPYTVYYTVPVNAEGTAAESSVAVLAKTAQLSNVLPDLSGTGFTQRTTGTITIDEDRNGVPWFVEDEKFEQLSSAYDESIYFLSDTNIDSSAFKSPPVQSFAYTGFAPGDAYIFKRQFKFASKADESTGEREALMINKDNLRLVKYGPHNEFVAEFELIDVPTPPANMDELKLLNGKFWVTKDSGDGSVKIDGTEPFGEDVTYTVLFVIQDQTKFDNEHGEAAGDPRVIQDPNGLFAQPRPSGGSSGCSVGENSVYDLALLALLALGLVALRVRARKG